MVCFGWTTDPVYLPLTKVTRRLKRLRKELAATPAADGAARIQALEEDLLYIAHYPKDRKYVSLFGARGGEDAKTARRRDEVRRPAREPRREVRSRDPMGLPERPRRLGRIGPRVEEAQRLLLDPGPARWERPRPGHRG